jgi:hypothetical protein
MSSLLDRYERDAVLLSQVSELDGQSWDAYGDMLTDFRVPARARENLRRARFARIENRWQPKAGFGPFRQMIDGAVVVDANQDTITGTAEVGLFPASEYTSWGPKQLRPGQVWVLSCFGIGTTPGSGQGNITLQPRFGTTTGGSDLGASAATALAASATDKFWTLDYTLEIRSAGKPGANSHVVGGGVFTAAVALIAASTGNVVPFCSTAAKSVDLTVAAGLFMGITLGSASDTMTCVSHPALESLN